MWSGEFCTTCVEQGHYWYYVEQGFSPASELRVANAGLKSCATS